MLFIVKINTKMNIDTDSDNYESKIRTPCFHAFAIYNNFKNEIEIDNYSPPVFSVNYKNIIDMFIPKSFFQDDISIHLKNISKKIIDDKYDVDENTILCLLYYSIKICHERSINKKIFEEYSSSKIINFFSYFFNYKFDFSKNSIIIIVKILRKFSQLKNIVFIDFLLNFFAQFDNFDSDAINILLDANIDIFFDIKANLDNKANLNNKKWMRLDTDNRYEIARICFQNEFIKNKIIINITFIKTICHPEMWFLNFFWDFAMNSKKNFSIEEKQNILYFLFFHHSTKEIENFIKNNNDVIIDTNCLNYYLIKKKNGRMPDKIRNFFVENNVKPDINTYKNIVLANIPDKYNFDFVLSLQ